MALFSWSASIPRVHPFSAACVTWRKAPGVPAAPWPASGGIRVTLGLGPDAEVGARWVRSWFAPGQPFLDYPSAANLRWLREAGFELAEAHDPAAIPEDRAARLRMHLDYSVRRTLRSPLLAREECGVEHVFLFPRMTLRAATPCPRSGTGL